MFGQLASLLRRLVAQLDAHAEWAFLPVVVDVDAKEVIGRHGHLEIIAQPLGTAVTAMLATVAVSQVIAVQVVLLFPVVSMQDVRLRWVFQVRYG